MKISDQFWFGVISSINIITSNIISVKHFTEKTHVFYSFVMFLVLEHFKLWLIFLFFFFENNIKTIKTDIYQILNHFGTIA